SLRARWSFAGAGDSEHAPRLSPGTAGSVGASARCRSDRRRPWPGTLLRTPRRRGPLKEAPLQEALMRLTASGLVVGRGTPPDAVYAFKHALVQDAAYETLLKSRRHELHARIARVLENDFAEAAETQPELLAHHYAQAGLVAQAIAYRYKAGRQALARSAMIEATTHLTQAL